jgi:hypothetical protein
MIKRHPVIVVRHVQVPPILQLLNIVQANDPMSLLFGLAQGWQEQGSQNGNDGDSHEEFDESESCQYLAASDADSLTQRFHQ